MTIEEMRALLGLGPEFSDAYVANAYAEYIGAGGAAAGDVELIPLAIVKKHLRLEADDDAEDDLVALYLAAAIAHLDGRDGWLGRALVERVYVQTFAGFDCAGRLPYPPLVAVTGVERRDGDLWLPIAADEWNVVDDRLVPVAGGRWPAGAARVTYRAGYDPEAGRPLPRALQAAILIMTADLFRNRGEVASTTTSRISMSASVEALLSPFRIWRV